MLSVFLKRYWAIVLSRKFLSIILCLSYIAGLILGLFLTSEGEKLLFSENAVNFTVSALGKESNTIKLFFMNIVTALGLIAVIALLGLSNWLIFLQFIIIIYRGYVLGACAMVFILNFKLTGIVLLLFAVLLQSVIVTIGLIFLIVFAFDMKKDIFKCDSDRKKYITAMLISLIICAIGCLVELVTLTFVLRPMNFYF